MSERLSRKIGSGSLPQVSPAFEKAAGCRDGVHAKGFGERSSPIYKIKA